MAATGLIPRAAAQPALAAPTHDRGDLALVPYYTVVDEWFMGLHIVNTSQRTQVVKVRFRRATDGMDALDFNLVLSPHDVYAGFLSDDASGAITCPQPTPPCTVPAAQGNRLHICPACTAPASTPDSAGTHAYPPPGNQNNATIDSEATCSVSYLYQATTPRAWNLAKTRCIWAAFSLSRRQNFCGAVDKAKEQRAIAEPAVCSPGSAPAARLARQWIRNRQKVGMKKIG